MNFLCAFLFPDTIRTFPNEVIRREFGKRWGRAPACPQSPSLGSKQKRKPHLKDESETEGDKQDYLFLKKKKKRKNTDLQSGSAAAGGKRGGK